MELVRLCLSVEICSLNDFIYFFCQAISSFTGSSPDQLSLLLGDSVHVREECDGK